MGLQQIDLSFHIQAERVKEERSKGAVNSNRSINPR